MAASKRLYEGIAESFRIAYRQTQEPETITTLDNLVANISIDLKGDNSHFDIDKFAAACNEARQYVNAKAQNHFGATICQTCVDAEFATVTKLSYCDGRESVERCYICHDTRLGMRYCVDIRENGS